MATLTAKLTLTSANATNDVLNLTATDVLTVGEPTTGISRKSIATGSAQDVLATNSAYNYVYLKNSSSTNDAAWLQVKLGGDAKIRLDIGEFAFIPLYSGQTVQAEAQTAACIIEFSQFTKA